MSFRLCCEQVPSRIIEAISNEESQVIHETFSAWSIDVLGSCSRCPGTTSPTAVASAIRSTACLGHQRDSDRNRSSFTNRFLPGVLMGSVLVPGVLGQQAPPPSPPQYDPKLVSDIKEIQKAALQSDYAYRQLAHLSNNIGPRLSGSPEAQAAVEYAAAELRKLGLDVRLEKVMAPHWVGGEETGSLVEYRGMAAGTTQKIGAS